MKQVRSLLFVLVLCSAWTMPAAASGPGDRPTLGYPAWVSELVERIVHLWAGGEPPPAPSGGPAEPVVGRNESGPYVDPTSLTSPTAIDVDDAAPGTP